MSACVSAADLPKAIIGRSAHRPIDAAVLEQPTQGAVKKRAEKRQLPKPLQFVG